MIRARKVKALISLQIHPTPPHLYPPAPTCEQHNPAQCGHRARCYRAVRLSDALWLISTFQPYPVVVAMCCVLGVLRHFCATSCRGVIEDFVFIQLFAFVYQHWINNNSIIPSSHAMVIVTTLLIRRDTTKTGPGSWS